jgi:adenylate cyclase
MADCVHSAEASRLQDWLIEAGVTSLPARDLLEGFCRRLVEAGFPLSRAFLSFATLHPQHRARSTTWQEGAVQEADFNYDDMPEAAWQGSPFRHMLETRTARLHRRLAGPGAVVDFPALAEFRGAGLTEWIALLHGFGWECAPAHDNPTGVVLSFATKAPGGWRAGELALLEKLAMALALAARGGGVLGTTRDVLATYLGADAAEQVIAGHVRRGSVGRLAACILYADLRGFTDFTETTAPEEVTRRLNAYFDCVGEPVTAAGGEILKFLGDGVLAAILPAPGRDLADVAAAGLRAAEDILARVEALNASAAMSGGPTLAMDIALHQGEVTFGNIGTADRLDFTVIGPAVNQATRLEGLCRELGLNLLISDSFARAAPALAPKLRSVGRHRLRGVREPQEVFAAVAAPAD